MVNQTALGGQRIGASDLLVDIVDDDASVRRALGRLLNSVGLRSKGHDSARSYLESGDRERAACLLLDIHLPDMSGIELLEHLSEVAPALPVICMTGRDEPEMEQRLAAASVVPCLRKPFDQAELFQALSRAIGVLVVSEAP